MNISVTIVTMMRRKARQILKYFSVDQNYPRRSQIPPIELHTIQDFDNLWMMMMMILICICIFLAFVLAFVLSYFLIQHLCICDRKLNQLVNVVTMRRRKARKYKFELLSNIQQMIFMSFHVFLVFIHLLYHHYLD